MGKEGEGREGGRGERKRGEGEMGREGGRGRGRGKDGEGEREGEGEGRDMGKSRGGKGKVILTVRRTQINSQQRCLQSPAPGQLSSPWGLLPGGGRRCDRTSPWQTVSICETSPTGSVTHVLPPPGTEVGRAGNEWGGGKVVSGWSLKGGGGA